MDKSKQLIITIFMDNINPKTVELHRQAVAKLNPGYPMVYSRTNLSHAVTMDTIWDAKELNQFESFLFLDIDAVPLSSDYFDVMFNGAEKGYLIGNAQSSNHINEGKHIFVAPSSLALLRETYAKKLGNPSAKPSNRGDVAEEYTWAAEENGVEVHLFKPVSWDKPVNRMAWETDRSPTWKLPDGTEYGVGTIFAWNNTNLIWHCFQSASHQDLVWAKCEEIINGTK